MFTIQSLPQDAPKPAYGTQGVSIELLKDPAAGS
jgi:hypothetical protein